MLATDQFKNLQLRYRINSHSKNILAFLEHLQAKEHQLVRHLSFRNYVVVELKLLQI
jgi:hypothetical protein